MGVRVGGQPLPSHISSNSVQRSIEARLDSCLLPAGIHFKSSHNCRYQRAWLALVALELESTCLTRHSGYTTGDLP